MAVIPARLRNLEVSLPVILEQCDRAYIHINGECAVPDFIAGHPRVRLSQSRENRGDGAKFLGVPETNGYYLSVDDDILYPPDYAARMIEALEAVGPDWLTCAHGAIFNPWQAIAGFYRRQMIYNFNLALPRGRRVMTAGTGALCMRTDRFRITEAECRHPNMADIWTACKALRERKGLWCVERPNGWLKMLPYGGVAISLGNPTLQVEAEIEKHRAAFRELFGLIIEEEGGVAPRDEAEALPVVSVVLPTRDRPGGLAQALSSIEAQDYPAIEVIVVNDGGAPVGSVCSRHLGQRAFKVAELPEARGPGAARNHGLGLVTGSYVTYMEDDAAYTGPHLNWLVTLAQVNPRVAFWYTACAEQLFQKTGDVYQRLPQVRRIGTHGKTGKPGAGDVALIALLHRRGTSIAFSETMPCFEDWLFIAQLAAQGPGEFCSANTPYVVHQRRLGDPGQLSENHERVAAALRMR
jgi:glycosyltransferase involved in cell wall biosynthesis